MNKEIMYQKQNMNQPTNEQNMHLVLMRYCAIPTASGVPLIVTIRSPDPSVSSAIFIAAPDLFL